jgi:hypothetical protein
VSAVKALGLTNSQFLIALVFGVLIGFTVTAISAPHPVVVPEQTIIPVPTPAPVVVGAVPTPIPIGGDESFTLWGFMLFIIPVVGIVFMVWYILGTPERMLEDTRNGGLETTLNNLPITSDSTFEMMSTAIAIIIIITTAIFAFYIVGDALL